MSSWWTMFNKDSISITAIIHEAIFEISDFIQKVLSSTCRGCYITKSLIKKSSTLDRGSDKSAFFFVNICCPQVNRCFVEHKSHLTLIIKFNSCWEPHGSTLSELGQNGSSISWFLAVLCTIFFLQCLGEEESRQWHFQPFVFLIERSRKWYGCVCCEDICQMSCIYIYID